MNRRTIIIVAVGALGVAAIIASVLLASDTPEAPEAITPTETATVTPTVAPDTVYEERLEESQAENPVLTKVPKITPFWEVEYRGGDREAGKLPLTAVIYIRPDQDEEGQVARQRGFIEQWLTSIGQTPGTYVLKVVTEPYHTY